MAEEEIGGYVVRAHGCYMPEAGKWQPILCLTRCRGATGSSISQAFNYLPALFATEADAIQYGFVKGRALVKGDVLGLTI